MVVNHPHAAVRRVDSTPFFDSSSASAIESVSPDTSLNASISTAWPTACALSLPDEARFRVAAVVSRTTARSGVRRAAMTGTAISPQPLAEPLREAARQDRPIRETDRMLLARHLQGGQDDGSFDCTRSVGGIRGDRSLGDQAHALQPHYAIGRPGRLDWSLNRLCRAGAGIAPLAAAGGSPRSTGRRGGSGTATVSVAETADSFSGEAFWETEICAGERGPEVSEPAFDAGSGNAAVVLGLALTSVSSSPFRLASK